MPPFSKLILPGAILFCLLSVSCCAVGQDFEATRQLFLSGEYEEAEAYSAKKVEEGIWNERWPRLLIDCQLIQGKYDAALKTYEAASTRYPTSLTLRMQGLRTIRLNNLTDRADQASAEIAQLMQTSPSRFASRDNLVAAGRYYAERGEDARQILELYDRVREADKEFLEAYIATAELALSKGDSRVAANTLQAAEKFDATDPRSAFMLAKAWAGSDSSKAAEALDRALKLNERHIPSLLLTAEKQIDGEQYKAAETTIQKVLSINAQNQEALALLAVIAHLRGDYENEVKFREKALKTWSRNPAVDHLIGRKLSQKYRFKEGAAYQRKAIEFDPTYTPANFYLVQDLLRLGFDEVGWQLARQVAKDDEYNVVAHNLLTLYDRLKEFSELESDGIFVRMEPREARIYGNDVIQLLTDAREILCKKYDVQPDGAIVVEIFPEQKDFAIRTFGLPGGAGFLGVCFGKVITANSPASQGARPSNWKSVLWHEFCHVVTLEKTKNRMPRWLSEGISVYEERLRDPSWGENMTAQYRQMLLDKDLTPVSNLSAAFLSPPSPVHLQFAYYESSLVVQYLVDKHGIDAMKAILSDLGDGIPINNALEKNVGSIDKLDAQFDVYAKKIANEFAPELDWDREGFPERPNIENMTQWIAEHPDNYWGLSSMAAGFVRAEQFDQALEPLERLAELDAVTGERGGPLEQLAVVYRELEKPEKEIQTLRRIVSLSSDALPALTKLIDAAEAEKDWKNVQVYAQKFLAINPLIPKGHAVISRSARELGKPMVAANSLQAMLEMKPFDPAKLHFETAEAFEAAGNFAGAKHHVMAALEEAPRYRDAHRLLLKLASSKNAQDAKADDGNSKADPDVSQRILPDISPPAVADTPKQKGAE